MAGPIDASPPLLLDAWTCEFNGLVMGASGSPISIVAIDGLLSLPDVRTADLALVQKHGLWPGADYLGGRTVTLTLEIYGRTDREYADALTALQSAFEVGAPEKKFRFHMPGAMGNVTAFVVARPRKRSAPMDLGFGYRVSNVVIELFATDPYIYGEQPRTATVETVPGTNKSPEVWFPVLGSVITRPVIRCVRTQDVRLVRSNGPEFQIMSQGVDFTIDVAARLVVDDGGNDITHKITAESEWPEFGPGEFWMQLFTYGPIGPDTSFAQLTWADTWL